MNAPMQGSTIRVIDIAEPSQWSSPVIFASPHSGRQYTADFLRLTRLDRHSLRQSEDSYVDLLFDQAPQYGSPFLRALFPRAYVDVNRNINELDPRMFADGVPDWADPRSAKVMAGLGVIPRIVADGHDIYARKLKFSDAKRRLSDFYEPYHEALRGLIAQAMDRFGCAVVIDCHSMPSAGAAPLSPAHQRNDFILGDRFGTSCANSLTSLVEHSILKMGYQVGRNAPYAGGFVASSYGRPSQGVHVIQIEINRAIYLDEKRIARTEGFVLLREQMQSLMVALTRIDPTALRASLAAE